MDRVLKRVGLSKRCSDTKTPQAPLDSDEKSGNVRRCRRSKSRRRVNQDTKKSRGLFNIDWESVKDCKSCKSGAITRRLCSKRCDNELYRSNSFKFERFVRGSDEISTLGKKISLCDDYSLPVDHLNKKRPNSFAAPSLSEWNIFTSNDETVEVLETYSTPRDSRQQLSQNEELDPKCFTSPDREYSQPYTTEGSSSPSSDEEFFGHISITKPLELNSPDSIAEAILPLLTLQSPERSDIKRHPSPYYYADLYKDNSDDSSLKTAPNKYRKQLDAAKRISNSDIFQGSKLSLEAQNQAQDNQNNRQLKYQNKKSLSLDTPGGRILSGQLKYRKSCSLDQETSNLNLREECEVTSFSCGGTEDAGPETGNDVGCADASATPSSMPAARVTPTTSCGCFIPEDGIDEDMTRQRHVYETAFDCRVSKSDDDLDQLDKVNNHPVLIQLNSGKGLRSANATAPIAAPEEDDVDTASNTTPKHLHKALTYGQESSSGFLQKADISGEKKVSALSENFEEMCRVESSGTSIDATGTGTIENSSKQAAGGSTCSAIPLRLYTPSPPSTAPLPAKFHGNATMMNSIRSAPNLPSHPKTGRLKDLRLPIKSLRGRQTSLTSDASLFELNMSMASAGITITDKNEMLMKLKDRLGLSKEGLDLKTEKDNIAEIKDRPSLHKASKKRNKNSPKDVLMEFKGRRRRHKYSSTESMTTSSSGGSMESIRSSTSEGNRSTTSSESRHSTSLSSHSSDSGGGYHQHRHATQTSGFLQHANKLHILSPISDKSSQEPVSETSDNNRNNNSQKCSPEATEKELDMNTAAVDQTTKQLKQRRMPQNKNLLNIGFQQQQQVGAGDSEIQGSDSGISIQSREGINKPRFGGTAGFLSQQQGHGQQDFSDLPFDMPKLRRRRLPTSQDVCTSGSATSIDLRDLPFDMPKLRRRLRVAPPQQQQQQQLQQDSSVSQASSSQSVVDAERQIDFQPKLTLNLMDCNSRPRAAGLSVNVGGLGLQLNFTTNANLSGDAIDVGLPLEKQTWYHGAITRVEAECVLRLLREGSFLVRNSESARQDYSLSLKSARGFMHMRIQQNRADGSFILGQFSKPFQTIPEMIRHFSLNRLPIRGAEHMCLIQPVIAQLL